MSTNLTRRAVLAGSPYFVAMTAASVAGAAAGDDGDDPALALWRRYQQLDDRRKEIGERSKVAFAALPADLQNGPCVHYGTYYQETAAPEDRPRGQLLYVFTEADINGLDGGMPAGPGSRAERLAAWKADLRRKLAAARRRYRAERERAGINALGREMDEIEEQVAEIEELFLSTPSSSPGGLGAKLYASLANGNPDWPIDHKEYAFVIAALRDLLPALPQDLGARVQRLAVCDPKTKLAEALRA